MAVQLPHKDQNEVEKYTIDWSNRLDSGESISSSSWTVDPNGVSDGSLTVDASGSTSTTATLTLSAGNDGKEYELLNRIVTDGGRTLDQTFKINVRKH